MQRAYLLHQRPYRETSALLYLFTESTGKISVVARGYKRPKNPWRAALLPFQAILVDFIGKTENLLTLTKVDLPTDSEQPLYTPIALYAGLYVNELLYYLLPQSDPYPDLFNIYATTLKQLAQESQHIASNLRYFEKQLCAALGYAIPGNVCIHGNPFSANTYYRYALNEGFMPLPDKAYPNAQSIPGNFLGKTLLAIHNDDYSDPSTVKAAKYLFQQQLKTLMGKQQFHSRKCFYTRGA